MQDEFTRRQFMRMISTAAALAALPSAPVSLEARDLNLPASLPAGVKAIIADALRRDAGSLNTDWFGTMLLHGLLLWSKRGVSQVKPFARTWLEHHMHQEQVSQYSGPRSRMVTAGGVPITTYASLYGLAFPCYEMAQQFGDDDARQVCNDIAKVILHRSSRNRYGMVAHDDQATFAIPDTCYFVAPPLMMASVLDPTYRVAFRDQALYQLRTYIDVFLTKDKGLSKTILLAEGLGQTSWTRASGWLLWAINGVLRHLPESDPQFASLCRELKRLAEGIIGVQDPNGGFHVLLDDPATPFETTGSAMFAVGLHEAMRRGWLPGSFEEAAERAWRFVQGNITPRGEVLHAYTGWAVPAENRVMSMDEHRMEWIPGMILLAANECTSR